MTTAEGGWGLDGILRNKQHVLNGVVNGIDMLEWDPSHDEHTAASYSVDDLSGERCQSLDRLLLTLRKSRNGGTYHINALASLSFHD